ncbi:hypothetical protein Bca52824_018886 [Brassica carinata]|uniref:MD-2-related lipid-recognition domain-containing protein n=1 Tax=Brassica carinata TaxID=52824 RepID=A0A8X7VQB1_BRACI|nr:hypothetical protein Bca52824_018886 [Brassica carinata]
MAISHGQPLLLLLLVSTSFLPAALGSSAGFINCDRPFDYPVVVNTVDISPDTITRTTNANITITGDTSIDIHNGTTVELRLWSGLFEAIRTYPSCDIMACPVKPGPIVLTFSNVFTQEELIPRRYEFGIGIRGKDEGKLRYMPQIMCIEFFCSISGRDTSLLRQVTE